ncbi:MAG: c-type cytochrome, methanol metabolism-related [Tistlia sp.]|uniref:c-type cytochrome, methanol metabolism-related n=1 Tax=Tistlia sp. TaxID=3057121 RepID=UPI0034A4D5AB
MFRRVPGRGGVALLSAAVALSVLCLGAGQPRAQDEDKPYEVQEDGTVDWYTFSGFRRYHAECHVCHGPDGLGSSFAPALTESLERMDYDQFLDIVVNGRQNVGTASDNVMPAFGMNRNVMCFIDDLYAYLKARSDGAVPRGRPKHEAKPEEARERDDACMG